MCLYVCLSVLCLCEHIKRNCENIYKEAVLSLDSNGSCKRNMGAHIFSKVFIIVPQHWKYIYIKNKDGIERSSMRSENVSALESHIQIVLPQQLPCLASIWSYASTEKVTYDESSYLWPSQWPCSHTTGIQAFLNWQTFMTTSESCRHVIAIYVPHSLLLKTCQLA